jgi:arylsulfatase A-like enzyme
MKQAPLQSKASAPVGPLGLVLCALLAACEPGDAETLSGAGAPGRPSQRRPNFLLISIDSLRADHLGCYGYEARTSPTIDAIAAEGALFTTAISTTSWTLPAHASMFTGQPGLVHGCTTKNTLLDPERETLAEVLSAEGYRTVGFYSGPYLHPVFGLDQGFDEYINCASFEFYGKKRQGQQAANTSSHGDITSPKIAAEVTEWLRAADDAKPFFAFVHMWDVHYDYIPPAPYDTMFDPDYEGEIDGVNFRRLKRKLEKREVQHLQALYDGEIAWTDAHIADIMRVLDEEGFTDDTVVIVTADHGEEFWEHGQFGHRKQLFIESVGVPLIFRYPGVVPAGLRSDVTVSVADIAPTVLELARAPALRNVFAESLVPLLEGGELPGRPIVSELTPSKDDKTVFSLRSGRWQYLVHLDDRRELGLWNVRADPQETKNLLDEGVAPNENLKKVMNRTIKEMQRLERKNRIAARKEQAAIPSDVEESLRALGYVGEDGE